MKINISGDDLRDIIEHRHKIYHLSDYRCLMDYLHPTYQVVFTTNDFDVFYMTKFISDEAFKDRYECQRVTVNYEKYKD